METTPQSFTMFQRTHKVAQQMKNKPVPRTNLEINCKRLIPIALSNKGLLWIEKIKSINLKPIEKSRNNKGAVYKRRAKLETLSLLRPIELT
jgi:hypothetical protein